MTLPQRKYLALPKAAELLKCSVEDLVYWAANGDTKLGIIYESDIFFRPNVFEPNKKSSNKRLEDFSGFAFIHASYMITAEVTGICKFCELQLLDGRTILFNSHDTPSEYENYQMIGIGLEQLYIRHEELQDLLKLPNGSVAQNEWSFDELEELYKFHLNEKVTKNRAFKKTTANKYGISTKRVEQLLKMYELKKPPKLGSMVNQIMKSSESKK